MAFAVEHLVLSQARVDQADGEVLDLVVRHLARVVLVEGDDTQGLQVEGERVHVTEVQDQRFVMTRDLRVLEGAEGRGRAGVEENGGRAAGQAVHQRSCARQVFGQLLRQVGEGAQVVASLDHAAQVVKAEEAVGVARR